MMNYKDYIAIIEDFPVKGISFKDITPLMQNGDVFKKACEELTNYAKKVGATVIVVQNQEVLFLVVQLRLI